MLAGLNRVDESSDFVGQLQQVAGRLIERHFLHRLAETVAEREHRMRRAGVGSAPLCPNRAFGPGYLDRLMMTKSRERLSDDRVRAIRKADRCGEMIVQVGLA